MIKNKIISSTLATVIAISSAVPLAVEATGIPGTNSSFDYDVTVTSVSDSQIKITFFTTHNPGVNYFTLAFTYDPNRYRAVSVVPEYNYESFLEKNPIYKFVPGDEKGIAIFAISFMDNKNHPIDYTDDFELSLYLEAKDGNITDEDLSKFTVGVIDYSSQSENIKFQAIDTGDSDNNRTKIEITPSQNINYEYILGDTDDSGRVNIPDAQNIISLSSISKSANLSPTINILNSKIANNETSVLDNGNTVIWGNEFNTFLKNVDNVIFPCVEAADANEDGIITIDDAQLVLDWYAQIAAGTVSEKDLLSIKHKTVYF